MLIKELELVMIRFQWDGNEKATQGGVVKLYYYKNYKGALTTIEVHPTPSLSPKITQRKMEGGERNSLKAMGVNLRQ